MWQRQIDNKVSTDVAQRLDLAARVADSLNLTFSFSNPASGPLDLTNYSFELVISSGPTTILAIDQTTGLTNNTTAGTVLAAVTGTQTALLPPGTYSYTLKATDTTPGSAYEKVWLAGAFYLRKENDLGALEGAINTGKTVVRIKQNDISVTINNS